MSDTQDRKDLAELALGYLRIKRCPGRRYVVEGYVCARCGHDYMLDGKCGLRKRNAARRSKEASDDHSNP